MSIQPRKQTQQVLVGNVKVGGGAPIVVQSMTNTDTADVVASPQQIMELATARSEIVRVTVNTEDATRAVPEIANRLAQKGFSPPLLAIFTLTAISCWENTLTVHKRWPNIASTLAMSVRVSADYSTL